MRSRCRFSRRERAKNPETKVLGYEISMGFFEWILMGFLGFSWELYGIHWDMNYQLVN